MRADIVSNQKGLKTNGDTLEVPSSKAMEKVLRLKTFKSERGVLRASKERLKSANQSSGHLDIKFKYREAIRNNL